MTRSVEVGKAFSWTNEPELMARLTNAQNALVAPVDIMSFAAFCESREELERHVARYEQRVVLQPKRRVRRDLKTRGIVNSTLEPFEP